MQEANTVNYHFLFFFSIVVTVLLSVENHERTSRWNLNSKFNPLPNCILKTKVLPYARCWLVVRWRLLSLLQGC